MASRNASRRAAHLLPALGLLLGTTAAVADADTGGPRLLGPQAAVRHPGDPVRIEVPGLERLEPERIVLELDDLDVTDVARVEMAAGIVTLVPFEPLAYGEHRLRLAERTDEGRWIERGAWTFEVRASAHLREATAAADTNLSGFRLLTRSGPDEPGRRTGSDGSAQLSGTIADGSWRLSAELELLHSSDPLGLPRERGVVDLGDFVLRGSWGPFRFAAGHQEPVPTSLIAQDLRRRGVSAGVGDPLGRLHVAAFAVRSQEVLGFTGGFGAGRRDDRVEGVTLQARPLHGRPDALVVSATWLDGRSPGETGEGVGGDDASRPQGRAVDLALESRLMEDRLRLQGEFARTRYHFDGDGTAAPQRDDAFSARLAWTALSDRMLADRPATLDLELERQRIGTFFRSIADPALVADRDLLHATASFSWSGWSVQAGRAHETDNVAGLTLLPRVRTGQSTLAIDWTPELPDDPEAGPKWYGQPSLSLNWIDLGQDVVRAGPQLPLGGFRDTRSLTLSALFSYPEWSWNAGHTIGRETDHTESGDDTKNRLTELGVRFTPAGRSQIGLSVQRSRTRDLGSGTTLSTDTLTLDASHGLAADIDAGVGVSWNRDRSSGAITSSVRTLDVTGTLRWAAVEAERGRPGIVLSLEAQHHRRNDRSEFPLPAPADQVVLRLAVTWGAGR